MQQQQQQPFPMNGAAGMQAKQQPGGMQPQQGVPMSLSYLDPMAGTSMMLPLGYPFGSGYQYPYGINVNQQTMRRDTTAEEGGMPLPSVGFGVPVNLPQFLDGNASRPQSLQLPVPVQLQQQPVVPQQPSGGNGAFQAPSSSTLSASTSAPAPSSSKKIEDDEGKDVDDENPVEIPEFVSNNASPQQQPPQQHTSTSLAARFAALKK